MNDQERQDWENTIKQNYQAMANARIAKSARLTFREGVFFGEMSKSLEDLRVDCSCADSEEARQEIVDKARHLYDTAEHFAKKYSQISLAQPLFELYEHIKRIAKVAK